MKKRQRITSHLAVTSKSWSKAIATCLGFRVTSNCKSLARADHHQQQQHHHHHRHHHHHHQYHHHQRQQQQRWLMFIGSWQLLALSIFSILTVCSAVGYSYARFEGPVAGPERLVTVPDTYGGGTHPDYVAQPEYSFAYGIEDGKSRVLQNRKETRHGDAVRGVYSVVDPDGTLRVVKYTADDENGFQAEVITNGVGTLHGHGPEGVNAAQVDQHVKHEHSHHAQNNDDNDDDDEANDKQQQQQPGREHYKVHEDHDEGDGDGDEGEGGGGGGGEDEGEGGGDHQEYEGSSEEGYEDANAHSQEQQLSSDEEY